LPKPGPEPARKKKKNNLNPPRKKRRKNAPITEITEYFKQKRLPGSRFAVAGQYPFCEYVVSDNT